MNHKMLGVEVERTPTYSGLTMENFTLGALPLLAAAALPLAAMLGLLAGIWLGFRISTKDAAMLARFATDASQARQVAERFESTASSLREEWADVLQRIETKRKSAAASASTKEAAERRIEEQLQEQQPVIELEGRERRRAIQRRLSA